MIVWLGGALVPEEQAAISIHDRGFLHGDAVFETALLQDGGLFRLREHLERFRASAATMQLDAPGVGELDGIVRDVVRANALRDANIRITLTRGVDSPVLVVTARPRVPAGALGPVPGWRLVTARTRRPSIAAIPAQLKAVGRTYALLARLEAVRAGVDDVLLLTDSGHVCEGPTWNVFWRHGDVLYTPALEAGVLAGVTRSVLIEIAPDNGLRVREGMFDRSDLDDADEIFATMTSIGVVTVLELDGRTLGTGTMAESLRSAYREVVAREVTHDPV